MSQQKEISLMEIKNEVLECLNKLRVKVSQIILFGSRARGDFSNESESDFDILIIIKNEITIEQKRNLWKEVYNTLHRDFPLIPFDVLIKTVKDFENEKDIVNTISNEAYIEGVRL